MILESLLLEHFFTRARKVEDRRTNHAEAIARRGRGLRGAGDAAVRLSTQQLCNISIYTPLTHCSLLPARVQQPPSAHARLRQQLYSDHQ